MDESKALLAPPLVASSGCPKCSQMSFAQGFLAGQASLVVFALILLKYVLLGGSHPAGTPTKIVGKKLRGRESGRKRRRSSVGGSAASFPGLLEACGYEPDHPTEQLDWLNVLIAQAVHSYRNAIHDSQLGDAATFEKLLNKATASQQSSLVQLDTIQVDHVQLGDNFPRLSNARARPMAQSSSVRIDMDLDYTDVVSISLSTAILLNFPKPRFAVLPVSLSLTVSSLSSALSLTISPEPTPTIQISIAPDFEMQVTTRSLLGSRAKLQDLPKVEQILKERIRAIMIDKLVHPARIEIALPRVDTPAPSPNGNGNGIADLPTVVVNNSDDTDLAHSPADSIIIQDNLDDDDDGDDAKESGPPTPASIDMTNRGPEVHLHPHLRTFPNQSRSPSLTNSGISTPSQWPAGSLPPFLLNGNGRHHSASSSSVASLSASATTPGSSTLPPLSKLVAESEARRQAATTGLAGSSVRPSDLLRRRTTDRSSPRTPEIIGAFS